ncbi:hypothetical protein BC829DRAFT_378931 [Chytridium lagenaria]|nr:hypothetical protein BC829DRAFT_378931 [Chytridium lagenaria]
MSSPTGWLVTVRSLEATTYVDINEEDGDRKLTPIKCDPKPWMGQDENMPNGFRTWLKEFEMVARERARTWNGSVRKANDIFNALADGTYRWQPIVQAVPCPVHEKTAVDYMMVNLCLIDTLYEHIPNRNAEERVNLRAHFNRFRLEQIYERLRLCPNLDLGRQLRHINDLNIADNAIISGTPPPTTTNTSSKEGCTSASPTIPASPEPDLPALPTEEPSTPTSSQTTWENASSSLSSSPTMSSCPPPKGHSLRRQNAGRFEKVRVYDDNGEGVEEICHVESSTSLPPAAEASLASASTL